MVVVVAEVAGDPDAWAAAAPATASAAAVGWKVATNGVCTGVGKTTGTLSTARVTAGVPSCDGDGAGGRDDLDRPAWSVAGPQRGARGRAGAGTQHGPVAVTVTW